jgi:hypothetical protein
MYFPMKMIGFLAQMNIFIRTKRIVKMVYIQSARDTQVKERITVKI